MMYGKFSPDLICRVIEKIYAERDENIEVKVRIIVRDETSENNQVDKTA